MNYNFLVAEKYFCLTFYNNKKWLCSWVIFSPFRLMYDIVPSIICHISPKSFFASKLICFGGTINPSLIFVFPFINKHKSRSLFKRSFLNSRMAICHIDFLIQLSRNSICSSVWNQCSPSFITVRIAPVCTANSDTVSMEVKLSFAPYKIQVGISHLIGCFRT